MNQPVEGYVTSPPAGYDVVDRDAVQVKNRVQAMPIIAGVLTTIAVMLILTVLGIAVGASALEPRDAGEKMATAAAIWGIVSAVISFFLGGWVAAKTAAVAGVPSGVMNGLMAGFAVLVLVLWLAGSGISGLVGSLGSNVGEIVNVVQDQGVTTQDAQQAQSQAQQQVNQIDPQQAFNTVKDSAWGTLAGLVVPLVAAALGGAAGHNREDEVIQTV